VEFLAIHDTQDGTFSERNPDCARPEYLEVLSEAVRREGAQLGVAFDGDGDRVAFVDGEGRVSTAEQTTWVLLRSFFGELEGRALVHDIKFSDLVSRTAKELGAHPLAERSGHAYLRMRMIASAALFGAEISGHYFYDALCGGDDGLFTACRMIAYLGRSGESLAALRRSCPVVYLTPEIRATARDRDATLGEIREAYRGHPQTTVDGIRVDFPQGWVLVRSSVTEDRSLTLRFEGHTAKDLARIVGDFRGKFPELVPQGVEGGDG
jgi:phosphomannomutase/phosphoglucomutase